MDLLHAVILGIVEGVTEFLPISSTGHLILTSHFLGLPQTNFLKSFEITIQLGAILSVMVIYWRSLLINFEILKRVMMAFLPTSLIGFALYKLIKHHLLGNNEVVLGALFLGGILLIIFEMIHRKERESILELQQITYSKSFLIGLSQALAVIPGVSRSAATILGGLLLGLKRKTIVEFSFLLAVPTLLAATGLDLIKNSGNFSISQSGVLALGFVTAFIVAFLSIKFLLHFIQNHTFIIFGIYRILIALLLWWTL